MIGVRVLMQHVRFDCSKKKKIPLIQSLLVKKTRVPLAVACTRIYPLERFPANLNWDVLFFLSLDKAKQKVVHKPQTKRGEKKRMHGFQNLKMDFLVNGLHL